MALHVSITSITVTVVGIGKKNSIAPKKGWNYCSSDNMVFTTIATANADQEGQKRNKVPNG